MPGLNSKPIDCPLNNKDNAHSISNKKKARTCQALRKFGREPRVADRITAYPKQAIPRYLMMVKPANGSSKNGWFGIAITKTRM